MRSIAGSVPARWVLAAAVLAPSACGWPADDTDPPLLACERPTVAELEETIADAVGWLDRAGRPDGRFLYEYDRSSDTFSDDYNDVRHAGSIMALYQVAAAGAGETVAIADEHLGYALGGLVRTDDRAAFVGASPAAELGASALLIAALVHRRIATGDGSYDELLGDLGRFMDSLRRDDGGMWARARATDLEPIEGQTSTFSTGEAFWAYGLLANQFPGEGWEEAAEAVGRYIVVDRDDEEGIEDPPHTDQWAAYGFAEMRAWGPLDATERTYVRQLSERYRARVERELERELARVGDGSEPPDESVTQSRGAAFGTTAEAVASLWRLAATDPELDDLAVALRNDAICAAAVLAARQVDGERAAAWPRPDVVEGAWYDEDVTRMDDQQHAMSGVLLALDPLAADR